MNSISWRGVYPAATTQFNADSSIDFEASQGVLDASFAAAVMAGA